MNNIIDIISNNTYFGVSLVLGLYVFYGFVCKKVKFSLMNPLLLTVATIIALLLIFNIPYERFEESASVIQYMLTPATVCFAVPLYRQLNVLKQNGLAILCGIFMGSLASVVSIFIMTKLMSMPMDIFTSLVPKSVTTPIATGIAMELGGIVGCTVIAVVGTGIIGSIFALPLSKLIRLKSDIALGVATGTSSHAIGTSTVMEVSEVAGAMSSLSIAIAGIMTVVIAPIVASLY